MSAVDALLAALLADIRLALAENLLGLYGRGSLALGDFVPATSDIDLLAAVERPLDAAQFAALAALHARGAALPNPFANRVEIAYIHRAALRRFAPGQRHPTLGQGEALVWAEHGHNWILERWAVREHGVVLYGLPPAPLIDPISPAELRAAVRARLRDWADWAARPNDPDWLLPRAHKAYVVETMCRALHALAHAALASKPRAVAWALATLPEPYRATVARSQAWRADPTPDPAITPEVLRFVRWATGDSTTEPAATL